MAKSKIPGFRQASPKEARELSKLPWVRDDELSSHAFEARVLPDGRVLLWLADGERAPLYPSREALAEVVREAKAMPKGPIDYTLTLLPPIDDFLPDVEAHAKSLGPRLRIPDEALDGTVASLEAVDKALKRIPWAKRQMPDLVTPLVAYVGEVLRRASRGRWVKPPATYKQREMVYGWTVTGAEHASAEEVAAAMDLARAAAELDASQPKEKPRGSENEPVIQASNGRGFQPFAIVFVPMVEPTKRLPLRAAVQTHLTVAGYPPAPKPGTGPAAGSQGKP